jgi:hypothetical protein
VLADDRKLGLGMAERAPSGGVLSAMPLLWTAVGRGCHRPSIGAERALYLLNVKLILRK